MSQFVSLFSFASCHRARSLGKGSLATRALAARRFVAGSLALSVVFWLLVLPCAVVRLPLWLHCPPAKVKIILRCPGCKSFIFSPWGRSPFCWLRSSNSGCCGGLSALGCVGTLRCTFLFGPAAPRLRLRGSIRHKTGQAPSPTEREKERRPV